MVDASLPGVSLLSPPYTRFNRIQTSDELWHHAARPGSAIVWRVAAKPDPWVVQQVYSRPGGLALIVILPTAGDLSADSSLWNLVGGCRPAAILPHHEKTSVVDLRRLLRRPPQDLGLAVTDYLVWRGIRVDPDTVRIVRRTIELSEKVTSVSRLARALYTSRRSLGRRFANRGLPVPSHWLQFGRQLRLAIYLQSSNETITNLAYLLGYPDSYSASNAMYRLLGLRPKVMRTQLGWEWIMETWLQREAEMGGFSPAPPDSGGHASASPSFEEVAGKQVLAGVPR